MSGYLLDTNCISELVRLKPEPSVIVWMQATDETLLYLSVLTLGKIRKGLQDLWFARILSDCDFNIGSQDGTRSVRLRSVFPPARLVSWVSEAREAEQISTKHLCQIGVG
jgi:predicted nucleic acid-binding protein